MIQIRRTALEIWFYNRERVSAKVCQNMKEGLTAPAAGSRTVRPDVATVRLEIAAAGKTIKTFKGYAIVREVEGVSVNGRKFSGVMLPDGCNTYG